MGQQRYGALAGDINISSHYIMFRLGLCSSWVCQNIWILSSESEGHKQCSL